MRIKSIKNFFTLIFIFVFTVFILAYYLYLGALVNYTFDSKERAESLAKDASHFVTLNSKLFYSTGYDTVGIHSAKYFFAIKDDYMILCKLKTTPTSISIKGKLAPLGYNEKVIINSLSTAAETDLTKLNQLVADAVFIESSPFSTEIILISLCAFFLLILFLIVKNVLLIISPRHSKHYKCFAQLTNPQEANIAINDIFSKEKILINREYIAIHSSEYTGIKNINDIMLAYTIPYKVKNSKYYVLLVLHFSGTSHKNIIKIELLESLANATIEKLKSLNKYIIYDLDCTVMEKLKKGQKVFENYWQGYMGLQKTLDTAPPAAEADLNNEKDIGGNENGKDNGQDSSTVQE